MSFSPQTPNNNDNNNNNNSNNNLELKDNWLWKDNIICEGNNNDNNSYDSDHIDMINHNSNNSIPSIPDNIINTNPNNTTIGSSIGLSSLDDNNINNNNNNHGQQQQQQQTLISTNPLPPPHSPYNKNQHNYVNHTPHSTSTTPHQQQQQQQNNSIVQEIDALILSQEQYQHHQHQQHQQHQQQQQQAQQHQHQHQHQHQTIHHQHHLDDQIQSPLITNVWQQKNSFELKYRIEPSPFFTYDNNRNTNIIIFAADHSGIYEYNNNNDRCKFIHKFGVNNGYSPTQYSYIYNQHTNNILFIGGRNSMNTNNFYDIMMIYNLMDKTMKQLPFGKKIGTNPKMILVHNNKTAINDDDKKLNDDNNNNIDDNNNGGVSDEVSTFLHIIGGSHNKYHILYNLETSSLKTIYQLPYPNGLMYHGLLYCKSQSTLLLFGGVYYNNSTASIQYSSDFWIFNLLNNNWNKINHKKLPKQMSGFGYILYNDRIIIIFGGKIYGDKCINNIYYLDILNTNSLWNESIIKCPLKGGYHAILEKDIIQHQNDKVHLFFCAGDKEHFIININDLLPKSILTLPKLSDSNNNNNNNNNNNISYSNITNHIQQQLQQPINTTYLSFNHNNNNNMNNNNKNNHNNHNPIKLSMRQAIQNNNNGKNNNNNQNNHNHPTSPLQLAVDNNHNQSNGINNNNNNNNNNSIIGNYNAIWIDKSKLGAKSRIECTPFYLLRRNVIIYSAEYNIYDENQGGIYEYDNGLDKHILIEKFEDHKYYPSGHTCIYNEPTEEIIFIGGKNVKNNRKPYEIMMIYDMNDHSMTKILFKRAIGSDPKLLLIGDDLHIIGGSHNTYHLCYNTSSNELKPIYPFPYSNGLSGHGLLYCKLNNTIITFGGAYYDYISCSYQFCNDYWVYNMNNHKYQCIYKKTLPQTINGFGYILYANRIVITFGGSIQRNKFIDNIYFTDILNINDSWKEASIKCPKKGGYHAILIDNQIVHLIHFGKEQFCMNIKDLLPASIINATIPTIQQSQQHIHHNQPSSNVLRAAQSVQSHHSHSSQQQQTQQQQQQQGPSPSHGAQSVQSPTNNHPSNNNNNNNNNNGTSQFGLSPNQFLHETPSLKELLSEYQNKIQSLQSENHRLKLDNAMFKSRMYAFTEDQKSKEFTIAKLQKEIDFLRMNCQCNFGNNFNQNNVNNLNNMNNINNINNMNNMSNMNNMISYQQQQQQQQQQQGGYGGNEYNSMIPPNFENDVSK